ncbi:DUF1501 domain-containing protein [Deminuibacter soli]|uniref:DUF1501 domain-containing protein n=1 Tax=Deminuibacter soli TaxID=2291815 RepID=A0A3E1NPV3_9BACT|nr:DUF1501 domain-containing protein [Deminuibacter soli]RFM29927.1 DUF1501 domain-containing protein [Deminuibacter soli]
MLIQRRKFLQLGSLATASMMVPQLLQAFNRKGAFVPQGNKVVVVLQLSGGNDGLNTVIPVGNDIYHKLRPQLGFTKDKALLLNDDAALHPALSGLHSLYADGGMAILNSVGYPDPDRSHFRSMDIWQSASNSNEIVQTGWLGRYLDAQCNHCTQPTQALEIDDVLSLALKGADQKGIALKDPRRLYSESHARYFKDLAQAHHEAQHERPVDYLYKTMSATVNSADYIFEQSKLRPAGGDYPRTELGNNLKTIASLIFSEINTKVYYVSLGSFDTHVGQQGQQQRLFKEMDDAVTEFVKDLKANNRFDDVLLVTFSEFGRRVAQNASGGTDHGTANNMFLVGGGLQQKGLINALPDLQNLKDGDLQYEIDFKNVYATILHKWLQADDAAILGRQYQHMNFI